MDKPKFPQEVREFFQQTGAQGGRTTAERYSQEQRSEWARKGGRPKGGGKKQQSGGK